MKYMNMQKKRKVITIQYIFESPSEIREYTYIRNDYFLYIWKVFFLSNNILFDDDLLEILPPSPAEIGFGYFS